MRKIIFLFFIIFTESIYSQASIETIVTIPVGNDKKQVYVDKLSTILDFEIIGEKIFISDIKMNAIKVFTKKGEFLYIILLENDEIARIYSYKRYLIVITFNSKIYIYSEEGSLVFNIDLSFCVNDGSVMGSLFYKDMLFIPQENGIYFDKDINFIKLIIEKSINESENISIKFIGRLENSLNPETMRGFLPIEKKHNKYLNKIIDQEFICQSERYVLFIIVYPNKNSLNPVYFLYVKKDHSFRRLGTINEWVTGNIGGGRVKIYDNYLYLLGLYYVNDKLYDENGALKLIISRIDLEKVEKQLPIKSPWDDPNNYKENDLTKEDSLKIKYDSKSLVELKILRNEIFARHGRTFKTEWLQKYFNNQPWYKPNPNYCDSLLTDDEIEKIKLIKSIEKEKEAGIQ